MKLLDVKGLTVGYGGPLLKDLSFSAEAGEIVGVLGRNGSGKTTLLRGLAGSIRRFSGQISIDGRSCTAMNARELAACLSFLPQHTPIMEGILVKEVIEMGCYPRRGFWGNRSNADSLQIVQCAACLGIQHLLEKDCGKLSQGQRQMVLLARLLVQDAPVMLMDEPNAALDYDNSQTMFSILRVLVREKKKAALIVLHDPELALRWCDRLLILDAGRLLTDQAVNTEAEILIQALSQIYSGIHVRRDSVDGYFRCYTENENKEVSLC